MANEYVPIERTRVSPARRTALRIGRAVSWLVYVYVLAVEVILLLGFVLLLFGANPSSSFVQWAYRNLDRTMQPFRGIFAPLELGTTANDVVAVIETSVLFAMIVYGIVLIAVQGVLNWLSVRAARLDREDEEYRREQMMQQSIAGMQRPVQVYASPAPPSTQI
jgi:hypothetical protein